LRSCVFVARVEFCVLIAGRLYYFPDLKRKGSCFFCWYEIFWYNFLVQSNLSYRKTSNRSACTSIFQLPLWVHFY
jgi:hypothetical protein